jgi:hypothetical protein
MSMNLTMSEIVPEAVLDKLWMGAFLSSYHPNGDQRHKLLNYGRSVATETLARNPVPAWQTGNPDIPKGKEREFIVAVRRKHRSEPFVFPATYANEFTDDDGLSTRDGGAYVANGWHLTGLDMSGEFNNVYEPLALNDGDEVVGWQALPKWSEPA